MNLKFNFLCKQKQSKDFTYLLLEKCDTFDVNSCLLDKQDYIKMLFRNK